MNEETRVTDGGLDDDATLVSRTLVAMTNDEIRNGTTDEQDDWVPRISGMTRMSQLSSDSKNASMVEKKS